MRFLIFIGFAALAGAWTAYRGIRASGEELRQMGSVIGTRNPRLARLVCWVAFAVLTWVGVGIVGAYLIFAGRCALGVVGDPIDDLPVAFGCGPVLVLVGAAYALAYPPARPPSSSDSDGAESAQERSDLS
jgi:hypothetical protein